MTESEEPLPSQAPTPEGEAKPPTKKPTPRRARREEPDSIRTLADELVKNLRPEQVAKLIVPELRKAVHDGLHDAIQESVSAADPHRIKLAEIDRIARNAKSLDDIRTSISTRLRQAGIIRVESFAGNEKSFVLTAGDIDGDVTVVQPAYVDELTGTTIIHGKARGSQRKPPSSADSQGEAQ